MLKTGFILRGIKVGSKQLAADNKCLLDSFGKVTSVAFKNDAVLKLLNFRLFSFAAKT